MATYFARQKNSSAGREDGEKGDGVRRAREEGRKGRSEIAGFLLFDKSLMENPANRGKPRYTRPPLTGWPRVSVRMVLTGANLNCHSFPRPSGADILISKIHNFVLRSNTGKAIFY